MNYSDTIAAQPHVKVSQVEATIRLQYTGAIQIVRDEVNFRSDIWTKVHPVAIVVIDFDDGLPYDACQNQPLHHPGRLGTIAEAWLKSENKR